MSNTVYTLLSFGLCIFSGLAIRFALTSNGQKWAGTFQHTLTYMLLPLTTFIITKVISNNIALSLGMIGALSIVRFRNPVKSPVELVIYFVQITLGISFSVSMKYGILMVTSSVILIYVTSYLNKFNYLKKFFSTSLSFEEGTQNYSIEIVSKKELIELIEDKYLIQSVNNKISSEFFYRIACQDKNYIISLNEKYKKDNVINSIELNF